MAPTDNLARDTLDQAPHRPLRRAEFEQMVELGVIGEDERVELLNGVLVAMTPPGSRHDWAIERLTAAFVPPLVGRARVRIQSGFALSVHSLPLPDVVVAPLGGDGTAHPDQAILVVEVADSSLRKDRGTKARAYAAAEIAEYWVVNLVDNVVEVSREPSQDGYRHVELVGEGELGVPGFSEVTVSVGALLGC